MRDDILITSGDEETAGVLLEHEYGDHYVLSAKLSTVGVEVDVAVLRGDEEALVRFAVDIIDASLKQDSWVDEEWVLRLLREKMPGFGKKKKEKSWRRSERRKNNDEHR